MKVINLTVTPSMPVPFSPPPMPGEPVKLNHSVALTAQFENGREALDFAAFLIAQVNEFNDSRDR